ncbi:Hypothetical protein BCD_0944 (plasmid) [Borrelia crocidurae DOU]|uniref:Uncharacterized protein n=1 Tax=Borrelia crocidurae DOU TaxID=1293575 RepID=W5SJE0_9SPIR|nr:hypothetical protein [Borrelia crocidurae]AHH07010.1 Hypothetical protein BCD_0944 [Borrelia crocidurae DOU]
MDLKVDNDFNLIFHSDFQIVNSVAEQKQRLFIFLKTLKGSLSYLPEWGFDYFYILRICKIGQIDQIKAYFYMIANDLKIDLTAIKAIIQNNILNIIFYFPQDSLNMEFNL